MNDVPDRLRAALADRYRVEREVGRGGAAFVYLAIDPKHNRRVALKVLRPQLVEVLGRERFLQEIRTTAQLEHPHILPLHDSGEADGFLYYVMPFVEEESLRQRLDREGQLPIDRAVQITKDVASGLALAHSRGIIHRDIKPANILLRGGHAVLADFGIAQAITTAGGERITQSGISLGTPEYMSPEAASGDRPLDVRSDIFSLGAVLYEMLVGEPPYRGSSAQVVLGKILTIRPARPKDVRETVPQALDGAVMRALARLPADRFSDVEHFMDALVTVDRRTGAREVRRRPSMLPRAAGVTLVVAALAWGAWNGLRRAGGAPRALASPSVTPFLTGEAVLKEPAWSPAGNLIAYVSDEAGDDDVWVADPSGANPVNLTGGGDGATDVHPAWSPDGQRIAFVSDRDGGGLFVMSALGGDVRRLTPVAFDGSTASRWIPLQWADDGSLVYTSRDGSGAPQVQRVPEGGGAPQCMTCTLAPGAGHSGRLLPGGRHLVFRSSHGPEPAGEMYLADLNTGEVKTLARNVALPVWSPALQRLLVVSMLDGSLDLSAIPLDLGSGTAAGPPQRLTSALGVSGLAVGPDGLSVLAARRRARSTIWRFPTGLEHVTGTDVGRQLTATTEFLDRRPRWTPGSDAVVFESNRRGNTDIWSLDLASGRTSRLTTEEFNDAGPRPSPDGVWIALERRENGRTSVHMMRADGSDLHPVDPSWATDLGNQCCVDWSPDGLLLALSITDPQDGSRGLAVAEIDPASGTARALRTLDVPGRSSEYGRFSPDGRFIAYEASGTGSWDLWIVDADGSNPRRLTSGEGHERQAAWSPDMRYLYYLDDFQDVWRLPLDGDAGPSGDPQRWFRLPPRMAAGEDGLDASPAGILLAVEEEAGDLWSVVFPGG